MRPSPRLGSQPIPPSSSRKVVVISWWKGPTACFASHRLATLIQLSLQLLASLSLIYFGIYRIGTTVGPGDKFLVFENQSGSIARLNADGTFDDTFAPLPANGYYGILPLPDGKYMAMAQNLAPSARLARLNADGTLDRSFAFNPGPRFQDADVMSVSVVAEGKLLVGLGQLENEFYPLQNQLAAFIRLQPDGSEDPAFPVPTFTLTTRASNDWNPVPSLYSSILLESDGAFLLAGGFSAVNGKRRLGFARLRPAPVLRAPAVALDGSFRASIGGQTGWTYRLETSTDLVNWALLRELPSAGALTEFQDAKGASGERKFYRVLLKP